MRDQAMGLWNRLWKSGVPRAIGKEGLAIHHRAGAPPAITTNAPYADNNAQHPQALRMVQHGPGTGFTITGPSAQGHYYVDHETAVLTRSTSSLRGHLTHPHRGCLEYKSVAPMIMAAMAASWAIGARKRVSV